MEHIENGQPVHETSISCNQAPGDDRFQDTMTVLQAVPPSLQETEPESECPSMQDSSSTAQTTSPTSPLKSSFPSLEALDAAFESSHKDEAPPLNFSLLELISIATTTLGKDSCSNIRLISCGAFNKVYVLSFNDDTDAIARLPHASGPHRDLKWPSRIESEVATMKYAKQNLSPEFSALIPTVYAWESTANNPVDQPYILMERMKGYTFDSHWNQMTISQKKKVAEQLAHFTAALHSVGTEFTEIGSIYHDAQKDKYYVGPYVDKFANIRFHIPDLITGPWSKSSEFFGSQVKNKLLLGDTVLFERTNEHNIFGDTPVSSIVKYLTNLYSFRSLFDLPKIANVALSTTRRSLFHDDLNTANIMIDTTTMQLTGILDWEGVSVYPDWLAVSVPKCFSGPDAYSPLTLLAGYPVEETEFFMEQTKLRNWYILERCGSEPGFSMRLEAYEKLQKLYDGIDLGWNILDWEKFPKWVVEELCKDGMI